TVSNVTLALVLGALTTFVPTGTPFGRIRKEAPRLVSMQTELPENTARSVDLTNPEMSSTPPSGGNPRRPLNRKLILVRVRGLQPRKSAGSARVLSTVYDPVAGRANVVGPRSRPVIVVGVNMQVALA